MRIKYKIRLLLRNIKSFFQRGKKGYCDEDLWDMDVWFVDKFSAMLEEFSKTANGHPSEFKDMDEWQKTLRAMRYYLIESDERYCSEKNEELSSNNQAYMSRAKEIYEYQEKCLHKFMELFEKHFWNLWD